MKTVLIISSQVAASRVGASAGAFCLQRLGVNTIVLPTVMLGRHPGWGPPGGGAVKTQRIEDMWGRIKEQDIKIDAVLTGYMASPEHVKLAASIINEVSTTNPQAVILVDPVMGDHGALYVKPEVAQTIIKDLIPLADYITPNLWELGYILGKTANTPEDVIKAGALIKSRLICTSVRFGTNIGAFLTDGHHGWLAGHEEFARVPHGGGDAFAAIFLSHIIRGAPNTDSLARAAASVFGILKTAHASECRELPLIEAQGQLLSARPLRLTEFTL